MTHDPYRALRLPSFRRYVAGHVLAVLGQGMLAVAVGWELYERTRSTLVLGLVGLVFVPAFFGYAVEGPWSGDVGHLGSVAVALLGFESRIED